MDIISARDYCLTLKGAEETTPFGPDWIVYKVMGKMFACLDVNRPDYITLKCDPDYAEELRERYAAVEPAYHFNKRHWNQIWFDRDVDDGLIRSLIRHSLDQVVGKMPKKLREAYAQLH